MNTDISKPTILILGSQGNLGSRLVEELQANAFVRVIPWTRKDCDLLNINAVETGLRQLKPAIIINTVAYNDVDACEERLDEQYRAIQLNIVLVEALARVSKELHAKLIHFSTNYVFSGNKSSYHEYDCASPINFYGMTKRLGEEAVLTQIHDGLNGCIVRVSNLFGPRGNSPSSKPSFFESITKAAENRDSLTIVNDEKSCFTYTKDVACAVADNLLRDESTGIFHFVNSDPVTWYEAAKLYFELIKNTTVLCPVEGKSFKRPAERPQSAILQITRITPMRSFKDALAEYVRSGYR